MNEQETRRYRMLGRVQTFGKECLGDFQAQGEAAKRFARIGSILRDIDNAKASQRKASGTAKEVLLDALRIDLKNIVRTARAIEQDVPGFADAFRMPRSSGLTALLTAVDAIILELEKPGILAQFIAHELPEELVRHLRDDRDAVAAAQDDHELSSVTGVGQTATVGRLIREGIKEVGYLDAIMHNKYTRNPDRLRAWLSARLIERSPRRARTNEPADESPATNTATPSS